MNELYGISALIGIFCSLVTTYLLFFISKGGQRYSNRLLAVVLLEAGGYFLIRLLLLSGSFRESVSINCVMGTLLFSIAPCSFIYIRSVVGQKAWLISYSVLVSLIVLGPLLPLFTGPGKEPWISAMAYALLSGGLLLKPGILFGGSESTPVSSGGPVVRVTRVEEEEKAIPQQDGEKVVPVMDGEKVEPEPEEVETAPQKPLFDEAQLREQMTRVSAFISAHHPFKKKGLTLAGLAVELSMPQHRLSYIIKHGYKQQFNDFINQHRVEYIKEKMSSCDDWKKMTLDAVGLDAGFSSRSTFFSVFRKLTGQTPSEFARQLKER